MSEKKTIRVRDVMKTDVHMIDGKCTVTEAIRVMKQHQTSVLFVKTMNTALLMPVLLRDWC